MKQPITLTGEVEIPGTDAISARLDDQASNINAIDAQLGTLLMRTFTPQQFGGKVGEDATDALQKCFDAAAKAGGEVYLSPGVWCGNVLLHDVTGMTIRGDSRIGTVLRGLKPNTPALRIEGFWYSRIADLGFNVEQGLKDCGVLEIDSGKERGVQANTFERLLVDGRGASDGKNSSFAMTMCRLGGDSAQGSEQLFLNCHFSGAQQACYYQRGFNALNNTFIGGNFQNYSKNGIELVCGSLHLFSVGFQSTAGYAQLDNDGWDIKADSGGVGDALVVAGCRTESLRFFKGCNAQPPSLIACLQRIAVEVDPKRPFAVVNINDGTISNCHWQAGDVRQGANADNCGLEVSEDYTLKPSDRVILVNAKADVKISLCDPALVVAGEPVTIVRAGGSKGDVIVWGPYIDNTQMHCVRVMDSAQFMALGGGSTALRWYRVK